MENLKDILEEHDDVVTLDSDEVIDRFFELEPEEKNLVRGLKIHKSMEGLKIKMRGLLGKNVSYRLYTNRPGTYVIYCLSTTGSYVGQSVNVKRRVITHLSELQNGVHYNESLQKAYNTYGLKNFLVLQLEIVEDISLLESREYFWDEIYKANKNGYNMFPTNPDKSNEVFYENGHPSYKLIKEEIIEICQHINNGFKLTDISAMYNISRGNLELIRKGQTWKVLTKELLNNDIKEKYWGKNATLKLFEMNVVEICEDLNTGASVAQIADKHELCSATIERIRKGDLMRDIGEKELNSDIKGKYWDKLPPKLLSQVDAENICTYINIGKSVEEIAQTMEISTTSVMSIRRGKKWKQVGEKLLKNEIIDKYWDKDAVRKLTENEAISICNALNQGETIKQLVDEYNFSDSTIKKIRRGKVWRKIGEVYLNNNIKDKYWNQDPRRRLTPVEVVDICNKINFDVKVKEIACEYKLNETTIEFIRNGTNWYDIANAHLNNEIKLKYWKNHSSSL